MASLTHERWLTAAAVHGLLMAGAVFMLFPFVWMIATSLKGPDEILSGSLRLVPRGQLTAAVAGHELPLFDVRTESGGRRLARLKLLGESGVFVDPADPAAEPRPFPMAAARPVEKIRFYWKNYVDAWTAQPFGRYFLNTIFVAVCVVSFQLLFSSLAAYAFAFFQFPFKNKLFLILLGAMMIPQQALLVPNYVILAKLHWLDTFFALIVPFTASVYAVFFFRQFFLTLPRDLWDAARVDGCGRLGFYFRILMPLSKPPMVTLGIFSFLASWNSFIWPLIVTNSTELRVLQVGLSYFLADSGTEWGPLMAASTFTILPLVAGYFVAQKRFVESQAATGLKE